MDLSGNEIKCKYKNQEGFIDYKRTDKSILLKLVNEKKLFVAYIDGELIGTFMVDVPKCIGFINSSGHRVGTVKVEIVKNKVNFLLELVSCRRSLIDWQTSKANS